MSNEIWTFFKPDGTPKDNRLTWTTFNITCTQLKERRFAKVTVSATNQEQLEKGEKHLREVLKKATTGVKRSPSSYCTICFSTDHLKLDCHHCAACGKPDHRVKNCKFIQKTLVKPNQVQTPKPNPTGIHLSRKARIQLMKRKTLNLNRVWWTMLGTFDRSLLDHLKPVGLEDDLKVTVAMNFIGATHNGKPILTIITRYFGGSHGVCTLYCAATKSNDLRDCKTQITGIQGNSVVSATEFSKIQDNILTCCTNRRVVFFGDIAESLNKLWLDYGTFLNANNNFISLQELYDPERVPLTPLIKFHFPNSETYKANLGPMDGANHEKETRFILRLYVNYYNLLKTYGQVPTGLEARNWLVDAKDYKLVETKQGLF